MSLRPLRIPHDMRVVHDWVQCDYARFWGMQGLDLQGVTDAYRQIVMPQRTNAFLGYAGEQPAFLVETYHPLDESVSLHYEAEPTDRGMHVLVAPAERRISGFTRAVFFHVMDFLFSDAAVQRVVVEPDVRNDKIRALNRLAGFVERGTIQMTATATAPAKTAMLSFCTRTAYAQAKASGENRP